MHRWDYKVGWICAMVTEPSLPNGPHHSNTYTLGRHLLETGNSAVTRLATLLLRFSAMGLNSASSEFSPPYFVASYIVPTSSQYTQLHAPSAPLRNSTGSHNIVIACHPIGWYGMPSAANVAKGMLRSFESIWIWI